MQDGMRMGKQTKVSDPRASSRSSHSIITLATPGISDPPGCLARSMNALNFRGQTHDPAEGVPEGGGFAIGWVG